MVDDPLKSGKSFAHVSDDMEIAFVGTGLPPLVGDFDEKCSLGGVCVFGPYTRLWNAAYTAGGGVGGANTSVKSAMLFARAYNTLGCPALPPLHEPADTTSIGLARLWTIIISAYNVLSMGKYRAHERMRSVLL